MYYEELNKLVEPSIKNMGYELSDLEVKQDGRNKLVRLFIDKPEGITLDDCESVSQQISLILDVEDLIPEDYTLEVYSPGLNRKLTKIEHYLRFLGSEVKVKLHPSIDGRKNYKGKLLLADEDEIEIEVDGQMHTIAADTIDSTRLIPGI